jgi:hypothetical protein
VDDRRAKSIETGCVKKMSGIFLGCLDTLRFMINSTGESSPVNSLPRGSVRNNGALIRR